MINIQKKEKKIIPVYRNYTDTTVFGRKYCWKQSLKKIKRNELNNFFRKQNVL